PPGLRSLCSTQVSYPAVPKTTLERARYRKQQQTLSSKPDPDTIPPWSLRLDGLVAPRAARRRNHRHRATWRGRLFDLRIDMFGRADHAAGFRQPVAEISRSVMLRIATFGALSDRGLGIGMGARVGSNLFGLGGNGYLVLRWGLR